MSLCSRLGQGVEKAKKAEQTQEWKSVLDLRGGFKTVSLFANFLNQENPEFCLAEVLSDSVGA